jgi:N-acyl-D-amino-acid deacylase
MIEVSFMPNDRFFQIWTFTCIFILQAGAARSLGQAVEADLVLTDGTIVDGSGKPGYLGSVAIKDGAIVAVGDFHVDGEAKTVPCTGKIICPGFIDLHNHSDNSLLKGPTNRAECYLTQGCTTLVTGNCGSGPIDAAGYYDKLVQGGVGINVAHLLPQGDLREEVIGNVRRAPTADEIEQMKQLAAEAMRGGAWGMSTGLQYVPGSYADTDELVAIASVVAKHGGIYASHMRDESDQLIDAVQETIEIGKRAHLPVHISHFKSSKRHNWGRIRLAAAIVEQAQQQGLKVTADQYPYIASSTSIMAMLLPDEEREGGHRETSKRLEDPAEADRLRPIVAEHLKARDRIMIASSKLHPNWVGKLIREVADEENREPLDVAMDILLDSSAQGVNFGMSEADVRYAMALPWVATASDGSSKIEDGTRPHPRSFGTFPRKIGRYAHREKVIPLEAAVRSASGLPADILGMDDRGYLRKGMVADVVVFDADALVDHATFEKPFEPSAGIQWVLLAGKAAIADGKVQEELHGQPLRRASPSESTP